MLYSYLTNGKYSYISFHLEQSFANIKLTATYLNEFGDEFNKNTDDRGKTHNYSKERNLISKSKSGIYGKSLTVSTLINIHNLIEDIPHNSEFFVLDFNYIENIQSNTSDRIFSIIDSLFDEGSTVLLLNVSEKLRTDVILGSRLQEELKYLTDFKLHYKSKDKLKKFDDKYFNSVEDFQEILFNEVFIETLKENTLKEKRIHHSSSVYLNNYIDIKKLLEDNSIFIFAIYKLALKMISQSDNRKWFIPSSCSDTILFCHTLNSTIIASILSDLLLLDIIFIDHLGPISKLYNNNFGERILINQKYLVVSDIVCLGTEIKIAKSIIEYSGGEYIGNVSLIRVEMIDKVYSNTESILSISKVDNPLKYKISTNFT